MLEQVPFIVQGVWLTLEDAWQVLRNSDKDGLKKAWNLIREDERAWNSMMHAALSSILAALFHMLFKFVIDPKYEETQKGYKDMESMAIVLSELVYRPLKPATDSFYGPLNIIQYLGTGTNPPVYNVPTKFASEALKLAVGKRSAGQFISNNFAFASVYRKAAKVEA